jgi:putative endonuclease
MNRQEAEKRGRGAETIAAWYLRMHGWQILARRARVPGGEVDIVAKRGRTLAFVEVKARADTETAALSLDEWRLRRVAVAAERLMGRYMDVSTRFELTPFSSSPSAGPFTCPTSGKGDKAPGLA